MSREIPNGAIVAERYQIIRTLGSGGFGRAYLAKDINRYDEQCVLKEFAPSIKHQQWDKAKELFDRECSQLYQLKHDQIPAFRELLKTKFAGELYVFLVQDYTRGLNYHSIVQKYGMLNEGQVICFLLQILPVLTYIHQKDLIHRDISPDNIICRFEDQKPVLIDFGLVRDVSRKYTGMAFTPAGKAGFSPPEQAKGVYNLPLSDLYALAATVLFLLTNQNPSKFHTERSGKWEFRQHVNISDDLSNILMKMLEFKPIDRYQTADEVSQAIAALPQIAPVPIALNPLDLEVDRAADCPATIVIGKKYKPSFTSSILELFHKANVWSVMKSDFAQPIKYVGGGLLALFLVVFILSSIFKGIGNFRSRPPQPTPTSLPTPPTPSETSRENSSSCQNINDRLKAAKISLQDVDERFYQKYPDRRNKPLDPKNISDRSLMTEWCQIAETLSN
jgi:serine/threonine protein kinase